MQETEPTRHRWLRLTLTLSAKLNILLLGAMVVIFALLGYLNVRLHRQHLEQNTLLSAERVSDVIKHSTTDYMLVNDQEGLYHSIKTMAAEPGMEKIRIFDQEGRITYTTDAAEQNHVVDKTAEACYACHAQSQPLARLKRPDRFRIYRNVARGTRSRHHYAYRESASLLQRFLSRASRGAANSRRPRHQSLSGQG